MAAQTEPWFYPLFVAVLGRESESLLVPLPEAPEEEELLAVARAKGFAYAGMFSLWPREPRSKVEVEPGMESTMRAAVPLFAEYVRETLTARFQAAPPSEAHAVQWLANLWKLEDPRNAN